ncbi:MAG: glycoside hydrolase family 2 TIM barrel-domain containing protein [Polyangiaceae bacterium]
MKQKILGFLCVATVLAVGCSSQTNSGGNGGSSANGGSTGAVSGGTSNGGGTASGAGTSNGGGTASGLGGSAANAGGSSSTSGGSTTAGAGGANTCSFPSCLSALATGCSPSGMCTYEAVAETGRTTVTYDNGVKQVSVLSVTDYSTALTVSNGANTCFTTAYIGNDYFNGAGTLSVKNASGAEVATLRMDATSSYYIVTCAGAQPVNVDKACAKTWPFSGLTTLPATTCNAGTGGSGGASSGSGGGTSASGGSASNGGSSAGGTTGAGGAQGSGGAPVDPNRARVIMPLDRDWRFNKGSVTGAETATFADSGWRALNVPHDWSIEGPFSETAPTTGRGGYVPAGIAWYRKHFTLPQSLSGRKVYVEFDGVMENSTVYVNGTKLGNHPYGYVSFRYDMTSQAKFGVDNVIAVQVDTSLQPNSRYYAGSGIYRHVRVLATDPVHVDQWATHVTTPQPTSASASVHVQTSILNSGSASASVSLQGVVSDSGGAALSPVSTPAQTIAAGASAEFSFDVTVANPKLWSPETPSLYQLVTKVMVGGKAVDDDATSFGIRSIAFSPTTGMSINGKSTKFKGVCLHQDYHGLGVAAPQRAMQRRLAQLKLYGVNAVRTAHDPPSPDFLDLCDRMGILVMNEFFDVWSARKYSDVGDYSTYFNKAATSPTGMPAVPGASAPKWYEVDVTGIVMRDRNHPSVAIYSAGNEIRDSLATRTPLLTRMIAISHALDPDRPVTQGLFRPLDSGDVTGATRTLLDVFGGNYRSDEVLQAMSTSPAKAGVFTEMGTQTSTWATVTSNAGLTGSFMWTGVDYLGEADGAWPTMGADLGILDALGTPKSLAFSWQSTWGAAKTTFSTGAAAGKVVLSADHPSITTDLNDVAFVKAALPTATGAVTFSITGPGTIVAVDSGSQTQESFRGNTRNAFGNLAFAIVQATGPGTITVTAASAGLTSGSATIQASEGTFVPCSGACD